MLKAELKLRKKRFCLDVSLDCPLSGITSLFGPSGAGKSTLLKIIAGLIDADHGHLFLGDLLLFRSSPRYALALERRRLGCVFQDPYLFPHLSVRSNLLYGYRRQKQTLIRYDTIVELLDLQPLLLESPRVLSGGEKQRVAIGRALLRHPLLLLLDEPVNALDSLKQQKILSYLKRIQTELDLPILYVSHALEDVLRLSDHLIVLDQGRVLIAGTPSMVVSQTLFHQTHGSLGTLLRGTIQKKEGSLSEIKVKEARFQISAPGYAVGDEVELYIQASSVIISGTEPEHISLLNRLPMTIRSMETLARSDQILLNLEDGEIHLLGVISKDACVRMNLEIGQRIFALPFEINLTRLVSK